jgi:hypothetical protein
MNDHHHWSLVLANAGQDSGPWHLVHEDDVMGVIWDEGTVDMLNSMLHQMHKDGGCDLLPACDVEDDEQEDEDA